MNLEAYILTLILFPLFLSIYFKHQTNQVLRTNTAYCLWDEACKAWGLNINRYFHLIQIATFWLAPKQEYNDAIANMDPCWEGETVSAE